MRLEVQDAALPDAIIEKHKVLFSKSRRRTLQSLISACVFSPSGKPTIQPSPDLFYKRKDTGANVEMVVYNGMENGYLNADGGRTEMINELHLAMIELYRGDAKRIQHFCKVHSYAKLIAETEHVDEMCLFILEAAALTHDIGIHLCEEKYGDCNGKLQEKEGPAIAAELLAKLGFDQAVSDRVQYLIAHHHTYDHIDGMDYQILVEADFLVNIMESEMSKEAAEKAYHNIFRTECGKTICREMFDI